MAARYGSGGAPFLLKALTVHLYSLAKPRNDYAKKFYIFFIVIISYLKL